MCSHSRTKGTSDRIDRSDHAARRDTALKPAETSTLFQLHCRLVLGFEVHAQFHTKIDLTEDRCQVALFDFTARNHQNDGFGNARTEIRSGGGTHMRDSAIAMSFDYARTETPRAQQICLQSPRTCGHSRRSTFAGQDNLGEEP